MLSYDVSFSLASFEIDNTRSRHTDTDFVTFAVDVGGNQQTVQRAMGDLNNGIYDPQLTIGPFRVSDPMPGIGLHYSIVNNGHGDTSAIENFLKGVAQLGVKAAKDWAEKQASGQTPNRQPGDPPVSDPAGGGSGSSGSSQIVQLGIEAGAWLLSQIANGAIAAFFANCDGPVVTDNIAITGSALESFASGGGHLETRTYPGSNSPSGCGSNSLYKATWRVDAVAVLPAWEPLPGTVSGRPHAVADRDGRLEVVARNGSAMQVRSQSAPSSGPWSNWTKLGGPTGAQWTSVAPFADGRLAAFGSAQVSGGVVGFSAGNVPIHGAHTQVTMAAESSPGGPWPATWDPIATLAKDPGMQVSSDTTAVAWPDGRVEVFWRHPDQTLRHMWQDRANGQWQGTDNLGGILTGAPVAAIDAKGNPQVFTGGTDGAIYVTGWDGGWHWASIGAPGGGNPVGPLAVGRNKDGRLEVFVRAWATDGHILHAWQTTPGGGWSGWNDLGLASTGDPEVSADATGALHLLAAGPNAEPHHTKQISPGGNWLPWERLGGAMQGRGSIGCNSDGRVELFVQGTDNQLYHLWQVTPNGVWAGQ